MFMQLALHQLALQHNVELLERKNFVSLLDTLNQIYGILIFQTAQMKFHRILGQVSKMDLIVAL